MSGDAPVDPAEIPVFTGNLALLDEKVTAISGGGPKIATAAGDVHTSFGGLRAFYQAPEAEQLFAVTKPASDTGLSLSSDTCVIAGALGTYSRDAAPLIARLDSLRGDAVAFRAKVADDDKWREDGDLIEENLNRRNEVAEVWTAFQEVERAAYAKIVALFCGAPLKVNDGSNQPGMYGYDAEALKQSKSLPWGDAVAESVPWWQVWEHAYDFGKGVIIDGAWATIKGLGTLVGFSGWDAAGQAWVGLGKLATGVVISAVPIAGAAFWAMPEDKLPSWLRDSRTAMKETGKALLAWDQWGENPSRAAGAVTFNVLTTVFTGGTAGAASGAGKAGATAKALSLTGKVSRAIDPMTYIFKGGGAGLSKIGDAMAGLKGMGNITIPAFPEGTVVLPEGAIRTPDGTIRLPEGATVPEGAVKLPDGTVKLPEGITALPPGTVRLPGEGAPRFLDPDGNILKEDGSVLQRGDEARVENTPNPTAGADSPLTRVPARQEQPVLAGVGARAGDDVVRVGSDISDPVRVGDNAPGRTGDTAPGGAANHLPGGVVGNNLPGGTAGNNMPTNNLDNTPGGRSRGDTPGGGNLGDHTPTGRTEAPPTTPAIGHDLPGGSATDNGLPGSAHPATPGAGGLDDAARAGDDAARAEYEAAREKPAGERTPTERAAITREHVRLANEDPAWRAQYYDKWGPGKRNSAEDMVDGQLLPKLVEKPDGSWMAADDLPYANPEKYHSTPMVRGRDTLAPDDLKHLDEVAAKRTAGMELKNADTAFEKNLTDETAQALAEAQKHYDNTVGADVSNNTKLGEALGEEAARRHMLLQDEFKGAKEVDDPPLPETPNGSKRFDQLWRDKDGNLILVEAKGPHGTLDWRRGNGELDSNTMVKQGTIEYVRTVMADMEQRAFTSPGDAKYAAEIKKAIENKTLRYVLVQATENTGRYAGAELKYFSLF